MRLLLALVMVVVGVGPASAERWTRTDTVAQVACLSALAADYVQTKAITADSVEANWIMGHRGHRVPPETYFATVAVAHTLVVARLPTGWRRAAQIGLLGVQAVAIGRNLRAGYGFEF